MKTFARMLSLVLVAVMLCAALVACAKPDKDPAEAEKKLDAAGYDVTVLEGEEAEMMDENVKTIVFGQKDDDYITIYYYEDKDDAKKIFNDLEADAKADAEELDVEIVCKRSGKMVYIGTKAAVKAAG